MPVTLARKARTVVGMVDTPGLLDVARQRAGNERVRWVLEDSQKIGDVRRAAFWGRR